MGSVNSHTVLIREKFSLFEQFSEAAKGWDLEFCQLEPADGAFFLEQIAGTEALISRAHLPARFLQRGCVMPGYRTVSILTSRNYSAAWRWCGETVTHSSLLVMAVGGEFESVSASGLDSIHLALSIEKLEQVSQTHFEMPLYELMPDGRCFCPHGGANLAILRRLLESVSAGQIDTGGRLLISPQLEDELVYLVLACLSHNAAKKPVGPRGHRRQTLDHALRVIDQNPVEAPGAVHLAELIGVSRRTLENAFNDGLGVTPAAYMKARRFCELSQRLYHSDARSVRVADLALACGFHHLGQMAADYRYMFGELPSQTLRCGSR